MRYIIAIFLPSLAVFLCGKPFQTIVSFLMTLLFWIPGVIHVLFVAHDHLADLRTDRIVEAIKEQV